MAADALPMPPSVDAISTKLRNLLSRAREIKQVHTVEPPLPVTDLANDVGSLGQDVFHGESDPHRFTVVETAARKIFYETLNLTSINDDEFVRIWDLLDLLLLCREMGQCEPILAFYLIEELLDSQTTEGCRVVFDYLESRRERLVQQDFHKTNLALLRSCNELLKRLSRAEDAVFCGRIFFYLFQTFPLGDKSSVNLRGEFHTENVTSFEQEIPDSPPSDSMVGVDESTKPADNDEPDTKDKAKKNENSKLYPVFWRLQNDFSEPTRLFNDENFGPFKESLERTIARFKATPVIVTKSGVDSQRGTKRKYGQQTGDHYANNYNPKYLTSRDLFELEMSDLAFQRHILVQGLILIDFLLSLTERSKKRWAEIEKTSGKSSNKALLYRYTLSEDNEKWVLATRSAIAEFLQSGPEGKYYYRMVETVLARDKNWVRWKLESCPSIVKDAVTPKENAESQAGAKQATTNKRMKAKPAGAIDVSFLAEVDNVKGLERLRDPSRFTAPSIEDLVKGIQNDELDLEMAMTDEEKHSLEAAKANKTWRALRAATRSAIKILDRVEPGKSLEDAVKTEEVTVKASEGVGADPPVTEPTTA
ncbi:hypothetical protein AAFC00_001527 [Neodothiora populina]|uniref:Nuclear matrix protein n=1 Tax=Neodothiora populina TaxID=2781224 RepID=A0ABR3PQ88_9PEZI